MNISIVNSVRILIILILFAFNSGKECIALTVTKVFDEVVNHPRVYIAAKDLPELKSKKSLAPFKDLWKDIIEVDHPFAKAFVGLVLSDDQIQKEAAEAFLPMLQACTDGRIPFNEMQLGACIYDWCYYQMDDSLKSSYIREFKRIAKSHSPYYPAKSGYGSIVGHNTEGWLMSDQLPAGLAIYNEDPSMYDAAATVFEKEFIPARNFYMRSHMHHQGDSYMGTRFMHDIMVAWLYKSLGIKVFSNDLHYVPYQLMYNYRPDGQQMRSGDTYDDGGFDGGGQSRKLNRKALCLGFTGWMYDDPYLSEMFNYYSITNIEKIFQYIFMPVNLDIQAIQNLPLTKYFPHPMGEMLARSGWETGVSSNSAIVQMRIGNYFFGNHQTKDFGIFQIYYKGPLAISSGAYQGSGEHYAGPHWLNYYHQTISKNGLLIYDPNETVYKGNANDGGQRWPNKGKDHPKTLQELLDENNGYKMGEVTACGFGPDQLHPVYSYIKGDITVAYAPEKADLVDRRMLTLNTDSKEFPMYFIVFDKVISKQAGFKKTWLLHSIQEPEIKDDISIIKRTGPVFNQQGSYNGRLICKTLLPENASVKKVGGPGKEFWVESEHKNYYTKKEDPASEEGAWRIEVSPSMENTEDIFLHAMAVSDADNKKIPSIQKLENGSFSGAIIENSGVLFNTEDTPCNQLNLKLDKDLDRVFIEGLCAGDWLIEKDGIIQTGATIDKNSGCLYLEGCSKGNYQLTRK